MSSIILRGMIDDKGHLQVETSVDLPPLPVEIEIRPEGSVGITSAQILESEFVGMWVDRDDIADSVEYARQLRRRANRPLRESSCWMRFPC